MVVFEIVFVLLIIIIVIYTESINGVITKNVKQSFIKSFPNERNRKTIRRSSKEKKNKLFGIPRMYKWLTSYYPNVREELIQNEKKRNIDNFYVDMNGVIHHCTHANKETLPIHDEHELFSNIIKYLNNLFELIEPKKLIYIGVDGVSPKAKMNQQRKRRFLSLYNINGNKNSSNLFNPNCITTGTDFMYKINLCLNKWFKIVKKKKLFRFQVFFSGSDVAGEGEHKILKFIRENCKRDANFRNSSHCIYGLDADLIMLSLVTHLNNIFILRNKFKVTADIQNGLLDVVEKMQNGDTLREIEVNGENEENEKKEKEEIEEIKEKNEKDGTKDSDKLETNMKTKMKKEIEGKVEEEVEGENEDESEKEDKEKNKTVKESTTNDSTKKELTKEELTEKESEIENVKNIKGENEKQTFRMYFPRIHKYTKEYYFDTEPLNSNDFEILDIYKLRTSIKTQIATYINKLKKDKNIIFNLNRVVDDIVFLSFLVGNDFLPHIPSVDITTGSMNEILNSYIFYIYKYGNYITFKDKVHIQRLKIILKILSAQEFEHFKKRGITENIREFTDETKYKEYYYLQKFGFNDPAQIQQIVKKYIEGLFWNLHYYHFGCASWFWEYPYHYAPMCSDLLSFQKSDFFFVKGKPYSTYTHLISVLPQKDKNLLPDAYKNIYVEDEVKSFFPDNVKIDPNGKRETWEYIVHLPFINCNMIDKIVVEKGKKISSLKYKLKEVNGREHRY